LAATLQRFGLIGDIHAEDASLALALRVLGDAGVDRILAVGDVVDGPGSVDRCCALLAEAGVATVRGNHERWFAAGTMRELPDATLSLGEASRAFLAALPATLRFPVPRGEVLLCHGLGDDDMASVALDAEAFSMWHPAPLTALLAAERPVWVLNGHTHRRGVWAAGHVSVVNAGTLFREHQPGFALVDLARDEVTYFDIDGDGRVGHQETCPVPPPRGARR
jgi:predicted phosphodiesterase